MDAGDLGRHIAKSEGWLLAVVGQGWQIPVLLETILIDLDEILFDHSACCKLELREYKHCPCIRQTFCLYSLFNLLRLLIHHALESLLVVALFTQFGYLFPLLLMEELIQLLRYLG